MPLFNRFKFHQNRPKIKLFFVTNKQNFRARGLRPQTPATAPPLQISGYALESNHAFAPPIFMPPEFSLVPRFKSIHFFQNKLKIKLILQKQ